MGQSVMKHIQCSGLPEIYAQLARRSVCPRYLCIMLYVKLMWCSGLPLIYGQLEEGQGQSVMKIIQCNGLPEIHARLPGVHLLKWGRLPNMNTLLNLLLLHRGLFYERPKRAVLWKNIKLVEDLQQAFK